MGDDIEIARSYKFGLRGKCSDLTCWFSTEILHRTGSLSEKGFRLFNGCLHDASATAICFIATNGLYRVQCKCYHGSIATTKLYLI